MMKMPAGLMFSISVMAVMAGGGALSLAGQVPDAPHWSGGIGLEEREAMQAKRGEFSLFLRLASKTGAYVGGANIQVRDVENRVVLAVNTDGPWLFAKLLPGTYTVDAILNGASQKQTVTIAKGALREAVFYWDVKADD